MRYRAIRNISEYIENVFEIRDRWCSKGFAQFDTIWFRGVRNINYGLIPGAYWRKNCNEKDLYLSFKAAAGAYLDYTPQDGWEWYILMQHYGIPTRLLDWTENALTALYFAITKEGATIKKRKEEEPGVWILNPGKLNSFTYRDGGEWIVVPTTTKYDDWLPSYCGREIETKYLDDKSEFRNNEFPLSIYPIRRNPRVIAQRGCFTVHGSSEKGIEIIIKEKLKNYNDVLKKIKINPTEIKNIHNDLRSLGVDHKALFPELSSLSRDLVQSYSVK